MKYVVTLSFEQEAASPQLAAEIVVDALLGNPYPNGTLFATVRDEATGNEEQCEVDLS